MTRTEQDLRDAFHVAPRQSSLEHLSSVIRALDHGDAGPPSKARRWSAPVVSAAAVVAVVATVGALTLSHNSTRSVPLASTSLPSVSSPAHGTTRPTSTEPSGWTQALQDKLGHYAEKIDQLVVDDADFADLGLDYPNVAVKVWYHGPLPAKLDPLIADARAAGVGIEHISAGWGAKAMQQKISLLGDALDRAGITWNAIGPIHDYNAISVAGPRVSIDARMQQRVREIAARAVGDIPIAFVPDPGPADNSMPTVAIPPLATPSR